MTFKGINMRNVFFKSTLAIMFSIIITGNAIAAKVYTTPSETFVIKITSLHNGMPFATTLMESSNNGTKITKIDEVTPYETTIEANFFSIMAMTTGDSPIKIKVSVKKDNELSRIYSATASSIFAYNDSDSGMIRTF
jgi:hypothetical protein